ncbi:MAG: ATP cone domain-containing protein [Chloroflexales bacterium]
MVSEVGQAANGQAFDPYLTLDAAGMELPKTIVKRDGRVVPFDVERIAHVLTRCFGSLSRTPQVTIPELAQRVMNIIAAKTHGQAPTVEGVQDIVEMVLQAAGEFEAAKHYILYRAEHAKKRGVRPIPEEVRQAFAQSDQFFPTALQKFQFFDKYSRFNYDLGRRETWLETVDRAVAYLYELAGDRLPAETYQRIRQAILEMRAMPSMRLLAMAGPAARRNQVAIYNCLSGDEKLLTYEQGAIPLREAVGTQTVLNKDCAWVPATVRSFGEQQTVTVEFGRYKTKKVVRATLNHEWALRDGRRVTTEDLRDGDMIPYTVAPRKVDTLAIDYRLGLMHGIIYGDGTATFVQQRNNGYLIRLCGDSRELLECFAGYPHSFPATYGGDPVVYLYDDFAKTHELKALPTVSETDDYLVGFIRGWFAADGYLSKQGQILFAADEEGEVWLRRVGPKVGFDFGYAIILADETNFGHRIKKIRNLEVRRASVTEADLILSKHLRNYREASTDRDWKFLGLVPGSQRVEEVFCATVPATRTFVLTDGLVTGNCSYQPVESLDSFVEALMISMSGCGVGFSVEGRYVENFPRIRRQTGTSMPTFVVEDSAEGWAAALRAGLETWFEGGDIQFDLSLLRSAGAPLRTKGGRASGPEPLRVMLDFVRSRLLARQGSFLRPIDAHDIMCSVGNAAVSGGVRRTALISIFDYDDDEMRLCKNGDFERDNSQRWNANNSAVWPDGGLTQVEFISQFLEMVQSGRGEPGIFNRQAAKALRPTRRQAAEFGVNPCVTGDTWVAVADGRGRARMADLVAVGSDVAVFTVKDEQLVIRTLRNPRKTGTQVPVYRVTFADGTSIRATANHRFVMLDGGERTTLELQPNDALTALRVFSYQKRGLPALHKVAYDQPGSYRMVQFRSFRKAEHDLISTEYTAKQTDLPIQYRAGLTYVTRTCEVCGQPFEVRFSRREQAACSASCSQKLYYKLHGTAQRRQLLGQAHAEAKLAKRQRQVAVYNDLVYTLGRHPNKQEWMAACKAQQISAELARESSPFRSWHDLREASLATNHRVVTVVADGFEDVYTGTVDETHTFFAIGDERYDPKGRTEMAYVLSWQCGEIVLRPWQLCNLSAAVARHEDTFDTLREKVELATIIGTIQSLATHFPGLRPQWQRNCEEERLLGVDITGQMDSPIAQDAEVKARLRHLAYETNREVAQALGINQSTALTCVKPSGNSSQLLNCSSGLHARWSPYYIRNVRVATHSPLFKVLRDAGVPMDPENGQSPENANTWVIHFPVKSPDTAITRKDRSALDQCAFWLQNKLHWTEHNPSCTIAYRPDEVLDLMKWVWEHRDEIGGLSFLPAFDAKYDNMPYVEISREEYERLVASFPEIDFAKIYRYEEEDLTNAAQELACSSGICELEL